jgi:DNA-binding protein H-NS
MKNYELKALTSDELWALHEQVLSGLISKLTHEKKQLDERLWRLNRMPNLDRRIGRHDNRPVGAKERRAYPAVMPKYRNPDLPVETWSGRGRLPRWVIKQIGSGRQLDEFRIQ